MSIKTNFILNATGSIATPRINHVFFNDNPEAIDRECRDLIAALSKAGYFNFVLYNVTDDKAHKMVAVYTVENPEPIVTKKGE